MFHRRLRRRALLVVLPLLLCGQVDDRGVRAAVEASIAAHKLPGAVIAAGNARGVTFFEAYGSRAIAPRRETMTTDTIFDMASLTKSIVTATLTMQLVEAGQIELDAPAATYLPELREHDKADITVRQLLLHSSGLPAADSLSDYANGASSAFDRILSLRLTRPIGTHFIYSDLGYIVLGRLIERVTGQSLAERAQRQLFSPLHMNDTGFLPDREKFGRIAPTEWIDARRLALEGPEARAYRIIRGEVHDPRAFRLGGIAGNAGLFSTAQDLSRFARMFLNGGTLDGARVLASETIRRMTEPERIGDVTRGLGWDIHSPYSGLRGHHLSELAFGHGGYTGTSLWIDPGRDLFVVFLSNRVHPDGSGYVIKLVGQVTDVLIPPLTAAPDVSVDLPLMAACPLASASVSTGIDVLRGHGFRELNGRRIGLVVNNASRARDGVPTLELFARQKNLQLRAIFAPEHGLASMAEGALENGEWHGLPVYSLFGKNKRPSSEMLRDLDTIVFDLPDVGTRFYTYTSTLRQILETCAGREIEVVVLDRPNPIGGLEVEGPVSSTAVESFVNYHPLPIRHGMTIGELAGLLVGERHIAAKLRVIEMEGYRREAQFIDTGLPWFAPSPNLPTAASALAYPALGLLEGTNLSVGRGTDQPFEFLGAPWIDAPRLVEALRASGLPGVSFELEDLTPRSDRYAGQPCHGLRMRVEQPELFRPVRTGLCIAKILLAQHASLWRTERLSELIGDPELTSLLLHGADIPELERRAAPALERFNALRGQYLRYPNCANTH